MGFSWHTDESGYLCTNGNVDTRHDGIVMLFTNSTSSETIAAGTCIGIDFTGVLTTAAGCVTVTFVPL